MSETFKDTLRAMNAAKAIIDGRDTNSEQSAILVTAEHAVAALLLAVMGTPRRAVGMLNEGLLQGVEERIALYASKGSSNV
jgi:hypothetical protein